MIREVTTATPENVLWISGNQMSRMHRMAEHSLAKRQHRLAVELVLSAFGSRLPRRALEDGRLNVMTVKLTRITMKGTGFDQHENLRQGAKHLVDGLSAVLWRGRAALEALDDPTGKAWKRIAGRDDGLDAFEWEYDQQRSADLIGLRVRVEDLEDGDPIIVLKDPPRLLGMVSDQLAQRRVVAGEEPVAQLCDHAAARPVLRVDAQPLGDHEVDGDGGLGGRRLGDVALRARLAPVKFAVSVVGHVGFFLRELCCPLHTGRSR